MANQSQSCYRLGMRGLFIAQLPLSFLCYWEVMRGLSGTQERKGWPNGDTHIYTIVSLFQCQLYVMNGFKCYVHPPWFTAWPEAKHQAKLKSLKKKGAKTSRSHSWGHHFNYVHNVGQLTNTVSLLGQKVDCPFCPFQLNLSRW